ncbi:OmpA family protein [Colwellia psychrerythraea]|uniref:OmpA family protein n=1 Tax=Colwellia psychrerythraea (strain 34H / ATCC BAA-681) TaxID=167879 RepID=Q47UV4_COLP3|nr:OmpA family protein [Colwellia psychrerythraea]AAZ28363.1 ompA family protein [Colwellia psychrerythraea 34H]
MRYLPVSKISQFIGLSIFSLSLSAAEQPSAESLVGKVYLGGHTLYLKTDEDRLFNSNANSSIDHASGVGAEAGYRISELFETRLSYTHFNPVAENHNVDLSSGKSIALDLLYFPFKESFYVVGGADVLDVEESNLSAALGAGYRHYLSKNMALYFEGKGHYQFEDNYTDLSAKLGFIYFFGTQKAEIKRSEPVKTKAAVVAPIAAVAPIAELDSDNDGVLDSKDNCANTPATDKVNEVGCTVFTEAQDTVELLINFDSNKAVVKEKYKPIMVKVAKFMEAYPDLSLTIKGHSSAKGSAAYNQTLSAKRAQAVVDVLINDFGVDASRLNSIGYGESELLNTDNTAAAHEQNRRIEATISTTNKVAEKR